MNLLPLNPVLQPSLKAAAFGWTALPRLTLVDPKTVCIEAAETPMMELLDKYGFEVIPVTLFVVSLFGGGLHCATADVYREGNLEDYFPKQIEGF